jgi:hypothetical protein
MKKRPDFVRLLGLALVAAAIALYARDCGRRQTEQAALLAVRAAAADPGALVAFYAPDPKNPGAKLFRPVRDAAVASNIVAALAATEPGWETDPASSNRTDHYAMLFDHDRRSAFFLLVRDDSTDRVGVQLLSGPPPVGLSDGFLPMSAAGLTNILARIESGELLDDTATIRLFDPRDAVAFTNVWPVAADADPAAALRALAARPIVRVESAPIENGAPTAPFRALEPAAGTNLVAALAAAETVAFPEGTREGNAWQLRLFADRNELFILQAAVLDERPADAYVGFLMIPAPGATNVSARLSAPALVPGLGGSLR